MSQSQEPKNAFWTVVADLQKIRDHRPAQQPLDLAANDVGLVYEQIRWNVLNAQYPEYDLINDEAMLDIIELAGPFYKSLNDMCKKIGWPYHKIVYRLKVLGCDVVTPIQLIRNPSNPASR